MPIRVVHMKQCSVAVIGSITIDTIIEGPRTYRQCGGAVTFSGITFKRCGIQPCVIVNVAHGDRSILDVFAAEGIPVRSGSSPTTTRFINYQHGDLRRQEMPQRADPITASQIEDLIPSVEHLHIGALHPEDIDADALRLIGRSQKTVSADIQGFVRYNDKGHILRRASDLLPLILSCARYVKADAEEIEAVMKAYDTDVRELVRRFDIEELVVTKGSRGGIVMCQNGDKVPYDAVTVESIVSTVGAGDVFFAAYLAGRLYRGESIVVSCETASRTAARQVAGQYITHDTLCPEGLQCFNGT